MIAHAHLETARRSPPEMVRRIRARGMVLDMPLTQEIYQPLLAAQRRDGVIVTHDLVYGGDPRHRLDIYQPQDSCVPAGPLLIYLHGGGFVRGDKADRENIGQFFARHGFTVIVPNYRLAPASIWPAGAEDVIAVYRWAREQTAAFNGDRAQVFLAGESAGAAHVATASLLRRFHPPGGLKIAGAILTSGVYNVHLEKLARRQFGVTAPDPRNEAYFGSQFERYPSMSTVELVDAAPFPLLISYAELDLLQMQVAAGELFARLIVQHGFDPDLVVIPDHNHLTQVYSVNTGDESLSQPVLDFLTAQLHRS